ncbi:MAG: bifunctional diaminohydroxyphosphoribosylaminopyrimidine deaminase/5-amino-6-(5-phosphoribosylamino)uracil reductase RibD [Deltaproteobacteria bacterium]|nr:bifunctional diaminohydroxyphosphoribosylaminopyrimidine deaminase/5-amino-6-(5-phosphoribosylamino)uracil reductase RibD [Deltaproteobacteria bacterium]
MARAIAIAALADGRTHPNPMVGAVVVRGGRVVGEGFHRQAGSAHAEVEAIAHARGRARGADLYVTLEPCCHFGRTPPCTETIQAAGIRRVVFGMRDPDRRMRGKGLAALSRAGIAVDGPCMAAECRALNPAFIHWATTGTPYVIAKVGSSLDGKIADGSRRSRWITNAAARSYTRQWRARVDGLVIGRKTLVQDDPLLTVRLPGYDGPEPQPIVMVGQGTVPRRARLVRGGARRPALFVVPPGRARALAWLERLGHEVIANPTDARGHRWEPLLRTLGARGMTALLVEGGAGLLGSLLGGQRVQYAVVAIAPLLLGRAALGWTQAADLPSLPRPAGIAVVAVQRFGDNVVLEGRMRYR